MRLAAFLAMAAVLAIAVSAVPPSDADDAVVLEGYVFGIVEGGQIPLRGAEVTLNGSAVSSYAAVTDSKGYFITSCAEGTYTMTVECAGFETVAVESIAVPQDEPLEISMEARVSDLAWGMDVPHALEVISILVLMGILAAGMIIYAMSRSRLGITMVNDLDQPEPDPEDDKNEVDGP